MMMQQLEPKVEPVPSANPRACVAIVLLLLLSTLLALVTLGSRGLYTGRPTYFFLGKDLFLGWIPMGLALAIVRADRTSASTGQGTRSPSRSPGQVAAVCALVIVWVLFLPNSPYLLTEFMHLNSHYRPNATRWLPPALLAHSYRGVVPVWFDVLMILPFAWTGLLLGMLSIRMVQQVICRRHGPGWGWASAVVWIALSAFGVTMGRFERFNSWDLFSKPGILFGEVASRLAHPLAHGRTWGATLLLGAFLMLVYLTMEALTHAGPAD